MSIHYSKLLLAGLAFASIMASCTRPAEPEITSAEIRDHIAYLASDELAGRYPGNPGDELVNEYIVNEYKTAGLDLVGKTGLQYFEIATEIESGPEMKAELGTAILQEGDQFVPFSFSSSGEVDAEVAFAGYGFQFSDGELSWDDYAGLDVEGSWVLLFRGIPGKQETSSPFFNHGEDRAKALLASDLGAAGVIFVSPVSFDAKDMLVELKGKQHALSIPVVQVSRSAVNDFLVEAGQDSITSLEKQITENLRPASFLTGVRADIHTDMQPKYIKSANTMAILTGSDAARASEYVIIGAHHDHLGMGGEGTSSRAPDTIAVHHGADDNASGVAGVLEICERIAAEQPDRSFLFASFGAEEMGLVGSKYLTEHPPIDLEQVQVMINLDMIGRLKEDRQLQIGGVGTSPLFRTILDSLNATYGFTLKYANEGYGPSDHASFYSRDIPVLFISTGAHPEYHTPSDRLEAINLEGAREVMDYTADVALALANLDERLAFTEAGPKVKGSSRGYTGGITLGLMPDVTYDGNEGMPVMFVTEGKPAAVGGIQKGDIIVAIEDLSVGNVYDYMSRLKDLKEGMDIVVKVKRGDDLLELVVRI